MILRKETETTKNDLLEIEKEVNIRMNDTP